MRSRFVVVCGLVLAFAATLRGQVTWNFTGGTGVAASVPPNITAGVVTASNTASLEFNGTSPSSGYTGSTGGNNAAISARTGAFSSASSSYFEVTLTAASGFAVRVSSVTLGSRSTASGPTALALYSSLNDYSAALGSATVNANSSWALVSLNGSTAPILTRSTVTLRIYGYDGTSTTSGNWRIDDVTINASAVAAPTITDQPDHLAVASGQTAGFTVAATGTGALTYQWRKAGVAIAGNTSAQTAGLDLGPVATSAGGTFDVLVTDANATTLSSPATLTVTKAPATVTVGAQTATYNGTSHSATPTTSPASLPTTQTYTATSGTVFGPSQSAPVNAGTYTVTSTINHSEYQGTGSGTLTIEKAPAAISLTAPSLSAAYDGSIHAATATTTPAGISHTITYNGSTTAPSAAGAYNVVATINHPNYSGATTGTLTIAPATATITLGGLTTTYNGSPQSATGTTNPAGKVITFTYTGINGTSYGPTTTPPTNGGTYSVTATLADTNFAATASGEFTIAAAPQDISFPPPSDRLAPSAPFALSASASSGLPVTFTLINGSPVVATLAGDTVTLTGATGAVTVRATQAGNANYLPAPAIERTFHVVDSATPPVITLQPVNTIGYVGELVQLTAHVSGAPAPQLQWKKNGSDLAGATAATLTFATATPDDAGFYQLLATNIAGTAASVFVNLEIRKRPQTITFPTPTTAFAPGSGITLSATADSGLPVTFALVSGAASLNGAVLNGNGGNVVVRAVQAGNDRFAAAEPVERTFIFVAGGTSPFIVTAPAHQSVTAGGTVTFRVSAIGNPTPTYQWQKDGVAIAGATSSTLVLPSATLDHTGQYTVVATNALGHAQATATLTVNIAPAIVSQPESQIVLAGSPVTLSVIATGTPTPTYQWRRNGTAISGATLASYTLANPTTANNGRYDVVVSNSLGTATSASATLTINTRDFAGAYFGTFSANGATAGDFALHVRANGTAVFLGHLPALQTGILTTNLRIEPNGAFSLGLVTLAAAPEIGIAADANTPPVAAAPRPVTLRGNLDTETGALTGSLGEIGATLQGGRSPATGAATTRAGVYQAAVVGSATARGYAIVGADGQAFLFTADGANLDSIRGTLDTDGRLTGTTPGRATVDLAFANGALTGTARTAAGTTVALAGATEALVGTQHLVNLSVRTTTSVAAPLITGFVVTGSAPKQVLIRAAGPALAGAPFNVPNVLADPTIQIFRGNTVLAQNDDWGTPAANVAALNTAFTRTGAFPFRAGSADAAVLTRLAPGAYTVLVAGGTGATLAEVYEVLEGNEAAGARRLVNVSARGLVTPTAPLIAGLVVTGPGPQRVLIRAVGPTLGTAPFNVPGALPNPQLTLFRGTTALLANDDWFRNADAAALIREAAARAGAFALGAQSLDAAMLLYLEPGAYTVQASGPTNAGAAGGTGIALIEIYESEP